MTAQAIADAAADADAAGARAGVALVSLDDPDALDRARDLFDLTWPALDGTTQVTPNLLRALLHAGAHVGAAVDAAGQIVGATLAFPAWSDDGHRHLHSHMAAVDPALRDRGIGRALKLHQRVWALERGIDTIAWTFDPLVRRNAELNLHRLGVEVGEYKVDFYGPLVDGINTGEPTDRLVVWWRLDSPHVAAVVRQPRPLLDAQALRADGRAITGIAIPDDIVDLRTSDPIRAREWRLRVREEFVAAFGRGAHVIGLDTHGYVLEDS